MRFDLTDLSLFRHVVEAGSITHGAERAHLALAAASTRIRNMEEALGAPLLIRGRQGVTPTQAGRTLLQHARTILAQAERLREDLGAYAGGAGRPGAGAVQHQCADRIPARGAELVPGRPSACQRRPRGAAERRDRRPDRRGRRRHRHRRRHRRCRPAHDLSVPQRPLRAGGRARPSAGAPTKIGFAEVLDHDFVGLDRASALQRFLAGKAAAIGRPLRLRVQLRSFDAVCRLVECNVGVGIVPETTVRRAAKTMAIKAVDLADAWALRELTICVRDFDALPPYARQLVEHMRADCIRSLSDGTGSQGRCVVVRRGGRATERHHAYSRTDGHGRRSRFAGRRCLRMPASRCELANAQLKDGSGKAIGDADLRADPGRRPDQAPAEGHARPASTPSTSMRSASAKRRSSPPVRISIRAVTSTA